MTRDERTAISILNAYKEGYKSAIEDYKQEPCDDAISRVLKRMWNCKGKHTTSIDKVKMEQIIRDELSSVTPKPIECDDAISREAVIKAVDAHTNEDGTLDDDISVILEDLPPVTQKPRYWIDKDNKLYKMPDDIPSVTQKSGKWITQWNAAHQKEYYYCSECREEFSYDGETGIKMNDYDFLP